MHAWINLTQPGYAWNAEAPDDGDQWVSWEQMVAQLRAKGEAEGRAAMLAREVVELRGEVAKFKPLEFLLLKGGDPVQQLSEAVLDLSAKVRRFEEGAQINLRQSIETRGELEKARAKITELEARVVLVPKLTDDEIHARLLKLFPDVGEDAPERESCFKDSRWAYNLAASRARAISPDRVLGEGMVAVDSLLYSALINLEKAVVREWGLRCTGDRLWNGQKAIADRRDSLRANQGGAAT